MENKKFESSSYESRREKAEKIIYNFFGFSNHSEVVEHMRRQDMEYIFFEKLGMENPRGHEEKYISKEQMDEIYKELKQKIQNLKEEFPNLVDRWQCCADVSCPVEQVVHLQMDMDKGNPVVYISFGDKMIHGEDEYHGDLHIHENISKVLKPEDEITPEKLFNLSK